MNQIIDADKKQKIIYYYNEARKSYNESIRQKKICHEFLHKACQLILKDEPFEFTDKELNKNNKKFITYSKDGEGGITFEG